MVDSGGWEGCEIEGYKNPPQTPHSENSDLCAPYYPVPLDTPVPSSGLSQPSLGTQVQGEPPGGHQAPKSGLHLQSMDM